MNAYGGSKTSETAFLRLYINQQPLIAYTHLTSGLEVDEHRRLRVRRWEEEVEGKAAECVGRALWPCVCDCVCVC